MNNIEELKNMLNDIINKNGNMLKENNTDDFYELGYDEWGPLNSGNEDDVYDSGYNLGQYAGEYYLAEKILELLK